MTKDDDDWIPIDIHLRRNADRAERVYRPTDWGWTNDYIWKEGNFSCDCNRYLFFQRAADEDEEENRPCGNVKYNVRIVSRADNSVLFDDYKGGP